MDLSGLGKLLLGLGGLLLLIGALLVFGGRVYSGAVLQTTGRIKLRDAWRLSRR